MVFLIVAVHVVVDSLFVDEIKTAKTASLVSCLRPVRGAGS